MKQCKAFVYVWLMNWGTRQRVQHLCQCDLPEGHAGAHIVIGTD